jgi:replicative superfamily II helicase
MPTGSGKSFLAELAASQALLGGWVLYLVPTNALAHQVRRDLKRDLKALSAEVLAFIGHAEYTTLEEERVEHIPPRTIVVMTPEKCSLAMRLNPEVFRTCRLCIFDECHLIAERSRRGVIAELVLSQLMIVAPLCRFLLMSAMVQNPEKLAKWLHNATGGESLPVPLTWRPTRSLRCAVGIDNETANEEYNLAKKRLVAKPDRFKNERFEPTLALLAGLRGAWQTNDTLDYALTKLPTKGLLNIHRSRTNHTWTYEVQGESWVNETSGRLGRMLAKSGIPTIVFLPANKHHSFSVAEDINLSEELQARFPKPSDRVRAFLTLAQDELGVPSQISHLIEHGLSVHTAGLLETEKFASEEAFHDQSTIIMLATGTLAQGLNLPAISVVIGGTRIGFPPKTCGKKSRGNGTNL